MQGKCQVQYSISPLPEYLALNEPELVPLPEFSNGNYFQVVKTSNFSNCDNRPGYNFGITEQSDVQPGDNQMEDFLVVSTMQLVNGISIKISNLHLNFQYSVS